MAGGFGAGFVALSLLLTLVGVAALLALTTAGAVLGRRRQGEVPMAARYLAVVLLAFAVGVSAFGVLALVDETPAGAVLLVFTVLGPLGVLALRLRAVPNTPPLDLLATAGMTWCLPFLAGMGILFGVVVGVNSLLALGPGTVRGVVVSLAGLGAGVGVLAGVLYAVEPVMRFLRVGLRPPPE